MFADARSVASGETLDADLCIVGAGAAGITLALEFAGTPVRVIVLESGGFEWEMKTQALARGKNVGLPYFPLESARLRYFGGTTNHYGGITRPFEEADFEPRPDVRYTGWPIRKRDLEPYYPRAAELVQLPETHFDAQEWIERSGEPRLPIATNRLFTRVAQVVKKKKRSFGDAYRDDIERARNVVTYLNANVTKVETDEQATRAEAVRVATLEGRSFRVRAKVFVLASGAVENSRVLLHSTDRRPNGLGNDRGLVGRFFLEHPRFVAATLTPADRLLPIRLYDTHHVGRTQIEGSFGFYDRVKRAEGMVDVQLKIRPLYVERFEEALDAAAVHSFKEIVAAARERALPDEFAVNVRSVVSDLMTWQQFVVPGAPLPFPQPEIAAQVARSPGMLRELFPALFGDVAGYVYTKRSSKVPLETIEVTARIDPAPNPASRMRLGRERDALGMRVTELDWRLSDVDRHSVARALELFGAEVGRAGLGRLKMLFRKDGPWPEDMHGGFHLMGLTRMSADASSGVVDRDCRVHGVSNLYVAGSGVFPTGGSGSPTLTITALALRLARHLKETRFR